jgi:hypothetical protein
MPFIENKYRGTLDWYIKDVEDGRTYLEALVKLCETLADKDKVPIEIFDGALNYTITQLYRKCDLLIAENLTIMILQRFYLGLPKYRNFKDVLGLLDAMITAWKNDELIMPCKSISDDVITSLERIQKSMRKYYISHEFIVKKRNGDL